MKLQLDCLLFLKMIKGGFSNLSKKVEKVNRLNVFPVPDGDTGTNMKLTLKSGIDEIEKQDNCSDFKNLLSSFCKGLLMGARGNSGVILSQLFSGFSKYVASTKKIDAIFFAKSFSAGVDIAYKAVVKPVEGTLLTVARKASEYGLKEAFFSNDLKKVLQSMLNGAKEALNKTKDLLLVLKKAQVVDAGGQGLVFIFEGMLKSLEEDNDFAIESLEEDSKQNFQQQHFPEDLKYGYCTEFLIELKDKLHFKSEYFKKQINAFGDSLLLIENDGLVKVHIHTEKIGDVLNLGLSYGQLLNIKIDNMRVQIKEKRNNEIENNEFKKYSIVVFADGKGIENIFKSFGADIVFAKSKTSLNNFEEKINFLKAENIVIFPNDKEILDALLKLKEQNEIAKELFKKVVIVKTTSIPQGISSLAVFDINKNLKENENKMSSVYKELREGRIIFEKGYYVSFFGEKKLTFSKDLKKVFLNLLEYIVNKDVSILTIIYGLDILKAKIEEFLSTFKKSLKVASNELDVEFYEGQQTDCLLYVMAE